jgi:hypothetical protein
MEQGVLVRWYWQGKMNFSRKPVPLLPGQSQFSQGTFLNVTQAFPLRTWCLDLQTCHGFKECVRIIHATNRAIKYVAVLFHTVVFYKYNRREVSATISHLDEEVFSLISTFSYWQVFALWNCEFSNPVFLCSVREDNIRDTPENRSARFCKVEWNTASPLSSRGPSLRQLILLN